MLLEVFNVYVAVYMHFWCKWTFSNALASSVYTHFCVVIVQMGVNEVSAQYEGESYASN